jgi:hypothetical protein
MEKTTTSNTNPYLLGISIDELIEWLGTNEAQQSFRQASDDNEELKKVIDGMTQIPQDVLNSYYSNNSNHLEQR